MPLHVTVVPVISKADTMTESELSTYRNEVMQMLQQPGKFVGARNLPPLEVNLFKFAEKILRELGTSHKHLPVAVVCSREQEPLADPAFLNSLGLAPEELGGEAKQPVRSYHWGACYPLNRGHSDLILLKRLLLGDQVESLYAMLDDSYGWVQAGLEPHHKSTWTIGLSYRTEPGSENRLIRAPGLQHRQLFAWTS